MSGVRVPKRPPFLTSERQQSLPFFTIYAFNSRNMGCNKSNQSFGSKLWESEKWTPIFTELNYQQAIKFADYLRTTQISVSTHNRKIVRLRKIFKTLQDYCEDDNHFTLKVLLRKEREEQDTAVRRLAFTLPSTFKASFKFFFSIFMFLPFN